jgi:23S rRNA (cytosine1962-C5)-methyltransferase
VLQDQIKNIFPESAINDFWIQERNFNQSKSMRSIKGNKASDFVLNEYGINYQIRLNEHYDLGIYTDMSALRSQMRPYIQNATSLLNLFSYTGAFSLFALKLGALNVVSVDLSSKYLAWLDENILLNPLLNKNHHTHLCMPTDKALLKLISENKKFEVVICDPPSASSDGQVTSNALKSYEKLLPLMLNLLDKKGMMFVFLNTHTISWNKFEEKLQQIVSISDFAKQINIGKRFKLSDDCLPLKGFHEGDYLKGILIDFKNKDN